MSWCGFFFFSSRRRHTRWTGDWSSDVCSSDLGVTMDAVEVRRDVDVDDVAVLDHLAAGDAVADHLVDAGAQRLGEAAVAQRRRSEERRVGKECRSRWWLCPD